jgi:hypothetical protein
MKISELVKILEELKAEHGDVKVLIQSLSHTWPPEPEIKKADRTHYVLLNP